jgi:hypothetical protein
LENGVGVAIGAQRLHSVIESLRTRPGHENVRGLVRELCVVGLGIPDREVNFEVRVPEVHGRIDAMFGSTIFEFKRDLRLERDEAEAGLTRYLGDIRQFLTEEEIEINVPGEPPLRFPGLVAKDPNLLDSVLRTMREFADQNASPISFEKWLTSRPAYVLLQRSCEIIA